MEISGQGETLIVKAPAKLNLFLEVLGRRDDGYHEIETVMQTVSIYDELTLERTSGSSIAFAADSAEVPHDRGNLVVQAAELLCERSGCRSGARLTLRKTIPVGAGLGGGSSDAAAALVGLDRLWQLRLPRETLHELAARIGSDVAFFLYGGTAICRGRGERVTPLSGVRPLTYVVVYPGINVSTREVYQKLAPDLTKHTRQNRLLLEHLTNHAEPVIFPSFYNRLEDTTAELHPPLRLLAQRMTESGLGSVIMTGSGSAFFGVAKGRKEAEESVGMLTRWDVGRVFIAQSTS